jgi:hypothetical protein
MNGTADRSGVVFFDPLTLTLSLGERGYRGERAYGRERNIPAQAHSLRPIVPKPPSPTPVSPCRAGPTGPGVRSLCAGTNR